MKLTLAQNKEMINEKDREVQRGYCGSQSHKGSWPVHNNK
jgi:hypothetical protein